MRGKQRRKEDRGKKKHTGYGENERMGGEGNGGGYDVGGESERKGEEGGIALTD